MSKLSKSYEDEQRTLTEKAKALHAELDKGQAQAVNVAQFIALVKKYSEIDIVYNFIGMLPTPQAKKEAAQPLDYATSSK